MAVFRNFQLTVHKVRIVHWTSTGRRLGLVSGPCTRILYKSALLYRYTRGLWYREVVQKIGNGRAFWNFSWFFKRNDTRVSRWIYGYTYEYAYMFINIYYVYICTISYSKKRCTHKIMILLISIILMYITCKYIYICIYIYIYMYMYKNVAKNSKYIPWRVQ